MKEQSLKSALQRGFTLIELMIVIVILGVLMGTILPRLTGAQARARDTGRMADLQTISQALEVYFDDYGQYPGTMGESYCLDDTADAPGDLIAVYLKGNKVPTPPASSQSTELLGETACVGEYFYAPLVNRGLDNNGYILASDMETYQKANADAGSAPLNVALADDTESQDFSDALEDDLSVLETADSTATHTIYIIVN